MHMDNMKHRRLQELDRSDFEIVEGQPDIRGWDVRASDGKKLGEVDELILDAKQRKVRYMVVDLDDNDFDLEERKVLIPIGMAELHERRDDVVLYSIQPTQLAALPEYEEDRLDDQVERQVSAVLRGASAGAGTGAIEADFYQHDSFNDDRLYRHRLAELEEKKRMESESGICLCDRKEGSRHRSREERDLERKSRRSSDAYRNEEIGSSMMVNRDRREEEDRRRLDPGDEDLRNRRSRHDRGARSSDEYDSNII